MKTVEDRLQFAVRLINTDLSRIRPGDLLNMRDDLLSFLGEGMKTADFGGPDMGGIVAIVLAQPHPEDYSEENFRKLQDDFRAIIEGILKQNQTQNNMRPYMAKEIVKLPISSPVVEITGKFSISTSSTANYIQATGSTQDMANLVLMHLLSNEPSNRILRCPECSKLFYRVKKQAYCSRICVNRATVREWRKTEEGKKKESDAAHVRYAKRVKATTGGGKAQRRGKQGSPEKGGSGHGAKRR